MKSLVTLVFLFTLASPGLSAVYEATHPYIQYQGRTLVSGSQVLYDWSGVSLAVWCTSCSTLTVTMNGGGAFFKIFVDGSQEGVISTVATGVLQYLLTDEIPAGPHSIQMVRMTEPDPSLMYTNRTTVVPTTVVSLQLDSDLAPPPPLPTRRMEFIGDASSDGYGVLSSNTSIGIVRCTLAPASYEDATEAYPFILGADFGAQVHLIAWSSKGLLVNAEDSPYSTTPTLPDYFDRAVSSIPNSWSFSWVPNVVVLFLGANDYYGIQPPPSPSDFIQRYLQFLGQVNSAYRGQSTIVAVCGGHDQYDQTPCPYIQKAVSVFGSPNTHFIQIPPTVLSLPSQMTCFDRPSATGHQLYASYLTPYLQEYLGW